MKRKVKFEHPRLLSPERMEPPVFPDFGDEIFQNGVFFFNVSAILEWLEQTKLEFFTAGFKLHTYPVNYGFADLLVNIFSSRSAGADVLCYTISYKSN